MINPLKLQTTECARTVVWARIILRAIVLSKNNGQTSSELGLSSSVLAWGPLHNPAGPRCACDRTPRSAGPEVRNKAPWNNRAIESQTESPPKAHLLQLRGSSELR